MAGKTPNGVTRRKKIIKSTPAVPPSRIGTTWLWLRQKGRQFLTWFQWIRDKYVVVYRIIGAIIIAFPPQIVGSYYQISAFADQFKKDAPTIADVFDRHIYIVCALSAVWVWLVLWIRRFVDRLGVEKPDGWDIAPVLRALDDVVGVKEQRFNRYLAEVRRGVSSGLPQDVFNNITQPQRQLNDLVRAIYTAFDLLLKEGGCRNPLIKVNLGLIDDDGKLLSIKFNYPNNHPVRSTIESLNHPRSTIQIAVRTKKIVVIESILMESNKGEKARFVVTDPRFSGEDGSLICYPVVQEQLNQTVLVLSIFVNQPEVFKVKYRKTYEELLFSFALRIKLEFALLALKP